MFLIESLDAVDLVLATAKIMAARIFQEPQSPVDKEGFLCPICVQDFGSAQGLANHFDSAHNDQSTDVLDHVKGRFVATGQRKFLDSYTILCI